MHPLAIGLLLAAAADTDLALPDAPTPTDQAAAKMTLPEGFQATLFAGEPDVVKPIAMTFDDRGRLWVVESHSYPNWITDGKHGNDRVLIFEDTQRRRAISTRCKVFFDKGTNLSGIAVGFGGVWLCSTPNLLFIPIKPGDDKPAGPAAGRARRLGPEGQAQRLQQPDLGPGRLALRLQRHPVQLARRQAGHAGRRAHRRSTAASGAITRRGRRSRSFAYGTTNPWGLDFDDYGEMFITNCVIKHLFHVVPGAHYRADVRPGPQPEHATA